MVNLAAARERSSSPGAIAYSHRKQAQLLPLSDILLQIYIPIQEVGNALVTPPKSPVSMGSGDHLYPDVGNPRKNAESRGHIARCEPLMSRRRARQNDHDAVRSGTGTKKRRRPRDDGVNCRQRSVGPPVGNVNTVRNIK
ncbi:hypothetical protein EVAR_23636_1 [Eumeta japonica]|uniref:Uncharacterized protein n=1 Tax=Eumeta variegata TaxID=151549 RepID=A0A4C1VJ58_EUMVA|nr:hypothetical protein EVAR_23636_1 [Eumeta japonica]